VAAPCCHKKPAVFLDHPYRFTHLHAAPAATL
jgi:hypothetical protein